MSNGTPRTAEMPFLQHLGELRTRLMHGMIGILLATVITYSWSEAIFIFLAGPIRATFVGLELIGTGPTEAFICKLKVGIASGVLLSCPFSFYQLWLFVAPGLHENERKFAIPFIALSSACFILGAAFCFFVVLPFAFQFFSDEFVSVGVRPNIRIGEYLGFVVKLVLVFGAVFELPILSYFLGRMKLLKAEWLQKNFRYAVVIIFIVAGILTPPDVITQTLLAGPLLIIYGLCILVTRYANQSPPGGKASDTSHRGAAT